MIAGDRRLFYLQTRDSCSNNKFTNEDAQGDMQTPEEQFSVGNIGTQVSISGNVTYMSSDQHYVGFTV